jgi:transcriptional regulator with XRE-family HTH domain
MIMMQNTMGKKRTAPAKKSTAPHAQFAARLRTLAGDRTTIELGQAIGVDPNTVGKWLKGDRMPHIDQWPRIAKVLGLAHYSELVAPKK